MFQDVESVAAKSGLQLAQSGERWTYASASPHITRFHYDLAVAGTAGGEPVKAGTADGYRIVQNWTVETDLDLWREAAAVETDAVTYVEALVRELRACEVVLDTSIDLASAQRVTILRHVEASGAESGLLVQRAAACLAMIDAPVIMLVDPWPLAEERSSPAGKLKGRSHIPKLLELGFVRMVGSRFLWGWNRELAESLLEGYAYEALVDAKQRGLLARTLAEPVGEASGPPPPKGAPKTLGVPDPDDLTTN